MAHQEKKLDSLQHVAIQVKDIARALKWYSENFNAEIVYLDDTWAMLRFENMHLALVVPSQHPPHIAIEHEGREITVAPDAPVTIPIEGPKSPDRSVRTAG